VLLDRPDRIRTTGAIAGRLFVRHVCLSTPARLVGATDFQPAPARIEYSARIMVSAPPPRGPQSARRRAQRSVRNLRRQLTRQFITRNRRVACTLSVLTIAIAVPSVHVSTWWFSPGVIILPILVGGLLLRPPG